MIVYFTHIDVCSNITPEINLINMRNNCCMRNPRIVMR